MVINAMEKTKTRKGGQEELPFCREPWEMRGWGLWGGHGLPMANRDKEGTVR